MKIRKIAVIGSGVMGRGIIHVSALAGYETRIYDTSQKQLEKAKQKIKDNMNQGIKIGKNSAEEVEKALKNIKQFTNLSEMVQDVDFVIEAIPEDIVMKCELFKELDELCPAHTILASNTSTMSPTEMGGVTKRPDKVIAMHFFNPVHKMKLVEIIRGLETSDSTYEITKQIAISMKKETVMVNEAPGFVTSRISALVGNEAFKMLEEGVASAEDIDKAIRLGLNYPMGPLALGDLVGLDTRLNILNYLHESLGERYRPSPLMVKYVKSGRLGVKSGKGVFEYNDK